MWLFIMEVNGMDIEKPKDNLDIFIKTLTYYQRIHLVMNYNTLFFGCDNSDSYSKALDHCDDDDVRWALKWLLNMGNLKG